MSRASRPSLRAVLRADLLARYPDATGWGRWRTGLRFLFDPSLQAVLTLRLTLRSRGRLLFVWRTWTIARYRMEVFRCEIGPGLHLPQPFGVVVARGTKVGSNVTLHHDVTLGFAREQRQGEWLPGPEVGDRVVIGAGSVVAGDAVIGPDARLAPGVFVDHDVPAGAVVVADEGVTGGGCFTGRASMPASPPASSAALSLWRLLAADYAALYARPESGAKRLLRGPVRFLTNPSLHAMVMIRAALAGPPVLMGSWRRALRAKHAIHVERGCALGPGLTLPHPFGLVLAAGVEVGANVVLYHNVRLGGIERERRLATILGDRAIVYTNTVIAPGSVVGAGAVIGANSLVDVDVPEGAVFKRGGIFRRSERDPIERADPG